jgi:hypothetical protein
MEERKKKKRKIAVTDDELEQIIKDKLCEDPWYYLNFLKKIIDDLPITMSFYGEADKAVPFEEYLLSEESPLKPVISLIDPRIDSRAFMATLSRDQLEAIAKGADLEFDPKIEVIDGVDFSFYPWVRKTISQWIHKSLDIYELPDKADRLKEKDKVKRIFTLLTYEGQTGPGSGPKAKKLTPSLKGQIESDYKEVYRKCKKILEARGGAERTKRLRKFLPDIADSVLNLVIIDRCTLEKLRNTVLATKYRISPRLVEESLRDHLDDLRFIKTQRKKKK